MTFFSESLPCKSSFSANKLMLLTFVLSRSSLKTKPKPPTPGPFPESELSEISKFGSTATVRSSIWSCSADDSLSGLCIFILDFTPWSPTQYAYAPWVFVASALGSFGSIRVFLTFTGSPLRFDFQSSGSDDSSYSASKGRRKIHTESEADSSGSGRSIKGWS